MRYFNNLIELNKFLSNICIIRGDHFVFLPHTVKFLPFGYKEGSQYISIFIFSFKKIFDRSISTLHKNSRVHYQDHL